MLTNREKAVLELMARGDTYAEIAEILSIMVNTVESHVKNLFKKMSVHSRGEAVFEAYQDGLLPHLYRGD
jgi:DNA-binding CsgD family transcriptional regulator